MISHKVNRMQRIDTNLALTIIGAVLTLIGVIFIAIPKVVNEKTMNDIPREAVNIFSFISFCCL